MVGQSQYEVRATHEVPFGVYGTKHGIVARGGVPNGHLPCDELVLHARTIVGSEREEQVQARQPNESAKDEEG